MRAACSSSFPGESALSLLFRKLLPLVPSFQRACLSPRLLAGWLLPSEKKEYGHGPSVPAWDQSSRGGAPGNRLAPAAAAAIDYYRPRTTPFGFPRCFGARTHTPSQSWKEHSSTPGRGREEGKPTRPKPELREREKDGRAGGRAEKG